MSHVAVEGKAAVEEVFGILPLRDAERNQALAIVAVDEAHVDRDWGALVDDHCYGIFRHICLGLSYYLSDKTVYLLVAAPVGRPVMRGGPTVRADMPTHEAETLTRHPELPGSFGGRERSGGQ